MISFIWKIPVFCLICFIKEKKKKPTGVKKIVFTGQRSLGREVGWWMDERKDERKDEEKER